ncbi:MAG: DedA family protein [Xanthomonadales bacterium]|nr:DedA family protein [Xanthomonadales bacterium]MCC6595928.1 DedA family protein [Rhodanobacteraceae bacterium]MDL1870520.1 DedA family protein [Gammaproteobacteria bacterium PRO6]
MRLFQPLYERALKWAAHRHAERYLGGLSFVEAIIFPVAPEIMLAPMVLARPHLWWRYATISLVWSMLGAFVGYALGHYAFDLLRPLLAQIGWASRLDALVLELGADVQSHPWKAFWMLVLAGFVPVPLKIFTWASGIVGMPLLPFIGGMLIGRGKRVYLLAGVIRLGGARAEQALHRWIEWIGWALVVAVAAVIFYWRWSR